MSYQSALQDWAKANFKNLEVRSDGLWADFCCPHGDRDASTFINLETGHLRGHNTADNPPPDGRQKLEKRWLPN